MAMEDSGREKEIVLQIKLLSEATNILQGTIGDLRANLKPILSLEMLKDEDDLSIAKNEHGSKVPAAPLCEHAEFLRSQASLINGLESDLRELISRMEI